MVLMVPREGELELLDKMLKDALSTDENYILKLFKNDYTPDQDDANNSFTEATFTAYVARTLLRVSWNSAVTSTTKAESSYGTAPESWTCGTNGNTIFGYWVEGSADNDILWSERFASSRVLEQDDVLNITPKFTLSHDAS